MWTDWLFCSGTLSRLHSHCKVPLSTLNRLVNSPHWLFFFQFSFPKVSTVNRKENPKQQTVLRRVSLLNGGTSQVDALSSSLSTGMKQKRGSLNPSPTPLLTVDDVLKNEWFAVGFRRRLCVLVLLDMLTSRWKMLPCKHSCLCWLRDVLWKGISHCKPQDTQQREISIKRESH